MKHVIPAIVLASATPAVAGAEQLRRLDDPALFLGSALGKQVNVRFSDDFAAKHFDKADFDALVVSALPDGKICFFGRGRGIDPADPRLADVAREEEGDICVARGAVSVRVTPQSVPGAPPVPFYSTDIEDCSWRWKTGRGIGLWTEDCRFETGHWQEDYDAAIDGFSLSVDGGDAFPVLRQFAKTPEEGPQPILPHLIEKGLVPATDCEFAPVQNRPAVPGWSFWEIVPVGQRKKDFDALPTDGVPEPPCGDLGYAADYIGFFMVSDGRPDRGLHVNLGQDGTMFDPFSVKLF